MYLAVQLNKILCLKRTATMQECLSKSEKGINEELETIHKIPRFG